ncbi:MAG: AAA family ATPase, partial [Actinomycetota bacterium]
EDPLRERLTELGMLALYRVGRQSEALALGRRLRERLLDDLGIDPGSAIAEMELRILNHDPVLEPLPGHANPFSAIITGPPADGDAPAPSEPPAPGPSPGSGSTPSDAAAPVAGLAQPDTVLGRGLATDTLPIGPEPTLSPISAPDPGVAARMVGPLVGRGQVRDRLATMERALSQDRMVAVAIVGEQGIGKTAIVRDAARLLGQTGAEVVWAHSVSDGSAPLWPWTQVVVGLIDGEDGPDLELTAGLGALAGLGQSVADLMNGGPAPSAPTAEIILAVTHLLARRARRGPIVVVLEDLHWADRSTVTVLEYAVSTLVDVPVAFISTWRDPENQQGPLAAGLRSLSRLPDLSRIDLRPFDVAEVSDLAAAMGRSLTPDQVSSLHRRTAGNPLFVDQLLADVPAEAIAGPPAPNLRALVTDRVERVHPLAPSVLRAAALFRSPFTAEDLEALHSKGVAAVEAVLAAAVRSHLLDEVDQALGTYRFRHPIVGDVLAADTLSSELRASHRTIGQQLLASDEAEASYHLGWSPDPADRALAARIALDVFHRGTRTVELVELDARIRNGLTAAELLGRTSEITASDGLVADALGFLSWRARVEDRPSDWADNGWRSLRAAMDEVAASGAEPDRKRSPAPFPSTAPLRAAGHDGSPDRPIDRLERAVLNLIGCPVVPAGPGDPEDFRIAAGPVAAEVAEAIETLATDNPVRVAAAIHLLSIDAPGRRGDPSRAKALRSAQRLLASARKRTSGAELAPALTVMVTSFGTELEADEIEAILDEHMACRPGPAASLLWARYGYPALVSAGRVDGARRKVETAMLAAEATGDPLQRAEARLLWTRHLLWAGELEAAEQSIAETAGELGSLGLAAPLPVLRQRRILRSLRGQSGDDPAEEGTMERATGSVAAGDRATPSELAFRLAHLGQREQASEHISQMASPERVAGIDVAELALLGAAANLVGHQPAARFFHQQLNESNDSLIVRHDGSAILGPIELWSSF